MKQMQTTKKVLIFDSGALISLTMNGISYILRGLKEHFSGKFVITKDVRREVIEVPLKIKRFELEALKVKQLLDDGVLEMSSSLGISDGEIETLHNKLLDIANSTFSGQGKDIHILDDGEASCLALSKILADKGISSVIGIDERTTRLLVEKPENLKSIFEERLNTSIRMNSEKAKTFRGFKLIRSAEISYVAYKEGLFQVKGPEVLDAVLYALKFKGAAISSDEIEQIKRLK
jgi:hypothetical protein